MRVLFAFAELRRLAAVAAVVAASAFGSVSCFTTQADAQGFTASKTPEGVQKKAVITAAKTKLFSGETGEAGKEAGLMDVFFILEGGGSGKRTPVATEPDKASPDGWLDQGAYAEWNSLQMVSFAPQGGRQLAEVFDSSKCAIDFSRSANSSCAPLGAEPDMQSKKVEYKMLVPVFKSDADRTSVTYEGGFVRVTPGQVVDPAAAALLP